MYSTKENPNANCRLWVLMICYCRLIDFDKHSTLVLYVGSFKGYL
jgi:hypothetical protein